MTASTRASPGRYRRREGVTVTGSLVYSRRPLTASRLNEAGVAVVDALDGEAFLRPDAVAARTGLDPDAVRTLLASLHHRGFLDWRPDRDPDYRPLVSIVVTTLDAGAELGPCLDALEALAYPSYEVVVVDGGSTDGTVGLARSHELAADGSLRVVEAGTPGSPLSIGGARNRGVAAAAGEVVAFTDADCRPTPSWLDDLVPCLAVHDVVGGRIRPRGDSPVDDYESVNSSLDMGPRGSRVDPDGDTPYLPTANLLARREVVESVPFPDRNVAEDVALCWLALEAGFDVVYHPAGVVEHDFRKQSRSFAGRRSVYAGSEALLAAEFGPGAGLGLPPLSVLGVAALLIATLAVLAGWPAVVPAGAGAIGAGAIAGPTLRRIGVTFGRLGDVVPVTAILESSLRGAVSTWYAVARELARYYSGPAAATGLALAGGGSLLSVPWAIGAGCVVLASVALVILVPLAVELAVHSPTGSYAWWYLLDTAGYQFGAYRGAVTHRTVAHLLPWRRFRLKS